MAINSAFRPRVLVLTNERDVSVDWVVRELTARGVPYVRLNTERLAEWSVLVEPAAGRWALSRAGDEVDFEDLRSIWYRRPERPQSREIDELSNGERALVLEQWDGLLDGLVAISEMRWINEPGFNRRAESKLLQLAVASRIGLPVPRTIVTNDRNRIAGWVTDDTPTAILKAVSAPLLQETDDSSFVFTEWLTADLLVDAAHTEAAPMIVQEAIWPKLDVRVTVIDGRIHAAITQSASLAVDWRVEHDRVHFVPHELPIAVADKCRELIDTLGLVFGAIDLVRDQQGQYTFLELNPNGEWGWLQKTAGIPIARSLVDALCAS